MKRALSSRLGAAAGCVLLVSCAAGPPAAEGAPDRPPSTDEALADRVFDASEVEERPELLGCAYAGPTRSAVWVEVGFVVDADGAVDETSIAPTEWSFRASQRLVERAMRVAATCRYRPGRIAGQAVQVRLERVFRFRR